MKITKNQLRKIIKEEIEEVKHQKILKEINILPVIQTISREDDQRLEAIRLTYKYIKELERLVDDNDAFNVVADFKDQLRGAILALHKAKNDAAENEEK
jgi:hypothetical protein